MDDLEIGDLDVAHPYDSRAALDTTFFFNGGGNVWRQSDDSLGVLAQGRGQRRDVLTGASFHHPRGLLVQLIR